MTINWVEVLMLSAYLEGDSFEGRNLDTLTDIDHWTRGGRDPFILALDANRDPTAWDTFMVGDKTWLAQMNAEIVTVTNSEFTCVAGKSSKGGSMIDYFIMSRPLVALIVHALAVKDVPWGTHYGIDLRLQAIPQNFFYRCLVKPPLDMMSFRIKDDTETKKNKPK